jgi:hypothetical protein
MPIPLGSRLAAHATTALATTALATTTVARKRFELTRKGFFDNEFDRNFA